MNEVIYILPDRCTIHLLAIGLQTLHDSGDSKFIVSFGTIQSPVYGTVCYNRTQRTMTVLPYYEVDYTQVIHLSVGVIIGQLFLHGFHNSVCMFG